MFNKLRLHGGTGEVLWGHRPAIELEKWAVYKLPGRWLLRAIPRRVDNFYVRQRPLFFTSVMGNARWLLPITALRLRPGQIEADLEPPDLPSARN